jgi:hypothetical protein
MIWHIVRKDLRLLWPLAAIVAAVNVTNAVLLSIGGTFARTRQLVDVGTLSWITNLALPSVGMIGLVLLVVSVIHQDPLPGTTQDWLTRPIPRSRLWAAKLIFVGLAGLAPIFLGDVVMGIAAHFRSADVIAASLTRSLALLFLVCAPAAMIAAVTRKLTEVLVAGIGLVLLLVADIIVLVNLRMLTPVMQSGYAWVVLWLLAALSAALPVIVVSLQSRWRSTHRVRWILLAVACLMPLLFFIPWNAAIRIQQLLGGTTQSALTIEWDAGRPMTFLEVGDPGIRRTQSKWIWLSIPVTTKGANTNERVYVDRAAFRLVGPEGRESYRGTTGQGNGMPGSMGFMLTQTLSDRTNVSRVNLPVPADLFTAGQADHSTIEVDLDLTEFELSVEKPFASLAQNAPDEHTRCGERAIDGSADKSIYCDSTREIGNCFEIREAPVGASPGKRRFGQCAQMSYSPWPLPVWRDPYYSVSYAAPGAWIDPESSRVEPDLTERPSSLILDSYSPTIHERRSISLPIDAAVGESSRGFARSVDGVGSAARFASPGAAVMDQRGNLFIVDKVDSVIRRMTPSGEVTTFAGSPRQEGRDDGLGANARFSRPLGIGIDHGDNLYVADTGNGLIRKITPAAVVSTVMRVAGKENPVATPLHFKSPVAVIPAGDGALYVIDYDVSTGSPSAARVKRIAAGGIVSNVAGPSADDKDAPP